MATKTINENPRITDTIVFTIECPNASNCYSANPYKVDQVVIYYVERGHQGDNYGEYEKIQYNETVLAEYAEAQVLACQDPTEVNLLKARELKDKLDSSKVTNVFYFRDRSPIKVIGNTLYPAWMDGQEENELELVETDEDGELQYGRYTYTWSPLGSVREGDYFICWTWTPYAGSDTLSAHLPFALYGDPNLVTTLPVHTTPEGKYTTLLERYLPEMYKYPITSDDLTPDILHRFDQAIAQGFTDVEDLANQIIDLFDANAIHELLLPYLSNFFNLKLKSNDPTLWRRQIKQAIPLYKQKGTLGCVESALAEAGMRLDKITLLWQVVSKYTWTESFRVTSDNLYKLYQSHIIPPINDDPNFNLWIRRSGTSVYQEVPKECVQFVEEYDTVKMSWVGDQLSNPIIVEEGDIIKILYQFRDIPPGTEQTIEDYIRLLPLGDQRDETEQEYPPKNWNVRVIEEDDPVFDLIVPVRHPYHKLLAFGWIRTEFPYSENIYNMEEYNGSTRESFDACMIDKSFLDPCGSCLSSKYIADISLEEISDDRIIEARDVLNEYTPFHAVVHSINVNGMANEFIPPPVEELQMLVTFAKRNFVIAGSRNPFFHRDMLFGNTTFKVEREDLAKKTTVVEGGTGIAYNSGVWFMSPNHNFRSLGLLLGNHILEVLSPSANAGTYTLTDVEANMAKVNSSITGIEPINGSEFAYNLQNVPYAASNALITQTDYFTLTDSVNDLTQYNIKSLWDVAYTPDYTGGSWKVEIYGNAYELVNILPNGVLVLKDDGTLPIVAESGVSYSIMTELDVVIMTSDSGEFEVERRGTVDFRDAALTDRTTYVDIGNWIEYDGVKYEIIGFTDDNAIIKDYDQGDASGVSVIVYEDLIKEGIGYFGYRGLNLYTTGVNYEVDLAITNGNNPPYESSDMVDDAHFKENYLFKIGDSCYKIEAINGDRLILSGDYQEWTTEEYGGTAVTFDIIHLDNQNVSVQFLYYQKIDRSGKDVIIREVENSITQNVAIVALSDREGSAVQESVGHEESINIKIERKSGEISEENI